MRATEDKHHVLAERIADLTGDICATVLRMEETNHSNLLGRLKPDLEKYASLSLDSQLFILAFT
jgi:hypothetical protein